MANQRLECDPSYEFEMGNECCRLVSTFRGGMRYARPRSDQTVIAKARDQNESRGPQLQFRPPAFHTSAISRSSAQSPIASSTTCVSIYSLHDTQLEEPIATMVREDLITSAVSLERVLATEDGTVY